MSVSLNWDDDHRSAQAIIDHAALRHNIAALHAVAAPAEVWAVAKAEGYGHGAVQVAQSAVDAGVAGLCVALVQEGVELRRAGLEAPILLLSQQPAGQAASIVEHRLTPTLTTPAGAHALSRAASQAGECVGVHMKIDTGMQRVGVDPSASVALAVEIAADPHLELIGVFTHLATADEPTHPGTSEQLERFDTALNDLAAAEMLVDSVKVHAANSAGALAHPRARFDMVRVGIAMYGVSPGDGVDHLCGALQPVMSLHSRVSHVKPVLANSKISYGLRHTFERDTHVATVPIGYADGVPRRLGASGRGQAPGPNSGAVLIGGHRCPIVGVVTMDQLMVDVGELPVDVGDEVVLIGRQGGEQITAQEWADLVGTIGYEITCGVTSRVPRRHQGRNLED